jgi:hypothetical protein
VEEGEVEGIEEEEAESVRPYTIANQEDRGSVLFARMIDSGFQGEKQLPIFSDTSKSEGWRGLYSLSVYGRSERKEVFLR